MLGTWSDLYKEYDVGNLILWYIGSEVGRGW